MSIEWFLYLADAINSIFYILLTLTFLSIGASFVIFQNFFEAYKEENKKILKTYFKYSLIPVVFLALACVLIPSKETMYAIGFTHYAKQTNIPQKMLNLLDKKLDEALNGEKL